MIIQSFDYLQLNFWSILGWGFLSLFLWRLLVGFRSYSSAMGAFKKNLKAILFAIFAIAYLISPVDLIPDVILILGQLDDLGILIGSIVYAREAVLIMVWGDKTVDKRFSTLIFWSAIFVFLSWIVNFGIYSYTIA